MSRLSRHFFLPSKTVPEVAGGAERNLTFDLLRAECVGTVDFAGAETMIDGVGGVADGGGAVFCCLVER